MDNRNTTENRLSLAAQENPALGDRPGAEWKKFSKAQQVRVEHSCALPVYDQWTRTMTGAPPTADPDPNTTPPAAANLWDLSGYFSLHGYLKFTGGMLPTASIWLWAYNLPGNYFFKVAELHGIRHGEEFRFDGQVRNRTMFLQVGNIPAGVTQVALVACPE